MGSTPYLLYTILCVVFESRVINLCDRDLATIALRFKYVRELIEVAQALEAYIGESQEGHQGIGKKRDRDYFNGRPPLPKKGKTGVFKWYRKKGSLMLPSHQQSGGRVMVG